MLDVYGHVKLIDFGLCRQLEAEGEPMSPIGSLIYMAPEMLIDHSAGRQTDWWAVGILAHELLTGRTPWSSLSNKKVIRKEIKHTVVCPPVQLCPAAGSFIVRLLQKDPTRRLGTIADIDVTAAPFFASIDWEATRRGESEPVSSVRTGSRQAVTLSLGQASK